MTRCPATGKAIATGIETDEQTFKMTQSVVARVYCPYCKTDHQWRKEDAWLVEDGPEQPRGG